MGRTRLPLEAPEVIPVDPHGAGGTVPYLPAEHERRDRVREGGITCFIGGIGGRAIPGNA